MCVCVCVAIRNAILKFVALFHQKRTSSLRYTYVYIF